MSKKVYICGDSFSSADPRFPDKSWPERLQQKIKDRYQVVNLSRPCSSNFFISLQVQEAIRSGADHILVFFTTSSRDEIRFRSTRQQAGSALIGRFVDLNRSDNSDSDLSCFSFYSLDHTTLFDQQQLDLLIQYQKNFFDLDLEIKKNEIIIEGILSLLEASGIDFCYDQGGFEHSKFSNNADNKYFERYQKYLSEINLWDHAETSHRMPCFHIADDSLLEKISDYYAKVVQ
jgi:hypothetical protein